MISVADKVEGIFQGKEYSGIVVRIMVNPVEKTVSIGIRCDEPFEFQPRTFVEYFHFPLHIESTDARKSIRKIES